MNNRVICSVPLSLAGIMIRIKPFINVKVLGGLHSRGFYRENSSSSQFSRVCVIGSGPAGFYTAQQLLKYHPTISVDILERFPVPFGLVRFGAAPDHAGIKNVTHKFTQLARSGRCHFIGNVALGRDVALSQLKPFYNAIVLAYGVLDDKKLGIPRESLSGIYSAQSFVGWYNGMPEHQMLNPDLSGHTAVIIGQGNVAIDIARILLTPVDILKRTDICDYALEALSKSNVQRVHMIGQGGPLQATLTSKELRELSRLRGCQPQLCREDFNAIGRLVDSLPRARKRLTLLMMKIANEQASLRQGKKQWGLRFFRSPVEFHADSSDHKRVSGVKLEINQNTRLESCKVTGTGAYEMMDCSMVIRSIGFKCLPVDDGLPFDTTKCVIPNIRGRVTTDEMNNNIVPGLYCSGWVKRGPYGNTPVTMLDAFETADKILEDLEQGKLPARCYSENVLELLHSLPGITPTSFSDWERIDSVEIQRGKAKGKPREKVVSLKEMMEIIAP